MKLLSIACFVGGLGLLVLAWRGTLGLTLHVYTFIFQPRHLLLTAIAFAIAGCVSAFATKKQ